MRWKRSKMAAVAIALLVSLVACRRAPEETTNEPDSAPAEQTPPAEPVAPQPGQAATHPEPPKPPEPPPKPTMPEVKLTEALAATCLVKVGDPLPEGTLADRDGHVIELSSTFGPKLTVLYFWKGDNVSALQGLQQLEKHVAGPYAERGVRVVAINEKDAPRDIAEKLKTTGVSFPCLLDSDGAYFAKVATEKLPRVYLVDPEGKILWFDTEYSRGTERNLLQAIDYVLAQ